MNEIKGLIKFIEYICEDFKEAVKVLSKKSTKPKKNKANINLKGSDGEKNFKE